MALGCPAGLAAALFLVLGEHLSWPCLSSQPLQVLVLET